MLPVQDPAQSPADGTSTLQSGCVGPVANGGLLVRHGLGPFWHYFHASALPM